MIKCRRNWCLVVDTDDYPLTMHMEGLYLLASLHVQKAFLGHPNGQLTLDMR